MADNLQERIESVERGIEKAERTIIKRATILNVILAVVCFALVAMLTAKPAGSERQVFITLIQEIETNSDHSATVATKLFRPERKGDFENLMKQLRALPPGLDRERAVKAARDLLAIAQENAKLLVSNVKATKRARKALGETLSEDIRR